MPALAVPVAPRGDVRHHEQGEGVAALLQRVEARPAGGAGAGNGIDVASADVLISKFPVQNALSVGAPPPFGYGVYSTATGLTVKDCTIINCRSGGIRATSATGAKILGCKLLGTDGGIYVAGNGVTVTKCAVYVSEDDGISITGQNALVQGNTMKKNRLDLANDGTGTETGNSFRTGGWAQGPEID